MPVFAFMALAGTLIVFWGVAASYSLVLILSSRRALSCYRWALAFLVFGYITRRHMLGYFIGIKCRSRRFLPVLWRRWLA